MMVTSAAPQSQLTAALIELAVRSPPAILDCQSGRALSKIQRTPNPRQSFHHWGTTMTSEHLEGFLGNVDQIVIQAETNDGRFERFCIAVASFAEGNVQITGTSTSWDLGRDGVGIGRASGIYLCTSLRDDIDKKALSDLERVSESTSQIKKLYFCFSQRLSEHQVEKLRGQLSSESDHKFEIAVLGSIQLAELGRKEGKAIERHYGAEIRDVLSRIQRPTEAEEEIHGLRLALLSSGPDESHAIREKTYANSILGALRDGAPRTIQSCGVKVGEELRLSRPIAIAAITEHLSQLVREELVQKNGDVYSISEKGRQDQVQRETEGAARLVEGRNAIKAALESAIGQPILHDEFARIWAVFEQRMSEYFQARGEAIVAEVSDLLGESDSERPIGPTAGLSFLEDFAKAVSKTSSHPQRQEELFLAVKDLFADRTGEASQWLLRICAAFVAACAMGLEHTSSEAITGLLRRTTIVLDSDAVLSLVGEGEPDHESVGEIVRRWTGVGGQVLVATPVLEECAYHAFIAERDYEQVRHLLPGTEADRAHTIENVFVRSFATLVAKDARQRKFWAQYIRQFKGRNDYDTGPFFGFLSTEHAIRRLPERGLHETQLVEDVNKYLIDKLEKASRRIDKSSRDKARRDSELYASLVRHVQTVKSTDPGATCLLVSSAKRLAGVDARFTQSGEQQLVISIAAALYLISLLPNARLGLSSMRAFLFDDSHSRFSSDLERTIIRMVRTSQEHSIPYAKRGILMREVRDRLIKNAAHRDNGDAKQTISDIESAALRPANRDNLVQTLTQSLDAVAADRQSEKTIKSLQDRVKQLEQQLSRKK